MEPRITNYFYQANKFYHYMLDSIDQRIGRVAAVVFDFLIPFNFSYGLIVGSLFLAAHVFCFMPILVSPNPIVASVLIISVLALSFLLTHWISNYRDQYRENDIIQMRQTSVKNNKTAVLIETSNWSKSTTGPSLFERVASFIYGSIHSLPDWLNTRKIAKTHAIHHIVADSENQVIEELRRHKNIDLVYILGHGDPAGIRLSKNWVWYHSIFSNPLMGKLGEKVNQGGKIVLCSCSTGAGESSFGKALSGYCPQATVYAPNSDISRACLVKFNSDYHPRFYNIPTFTPALTRSFQGGQEIGIPAKRPLHPAPLSQELA